MEEQTLRIRGSEADIGQLQKEIAAELERYGAEADGVDVSEPRRPQRKLTDRAALGHYEWVELVVKIAVPLVTSVSTELIKTWIKSRAEAKGLKVEDAHSAAAPPAQP